MDEEKMKKVNMTGDKEENSKDSLSEGMKEGWKQMKEGKMDTR